MQSRYLMVAGLVASTAISIIGFALSPSTTSAQTKSCYPPEYNGSGDLLLPRNFHEWIYVGSPLTPNALNGCDAGFPEYHNVYMEPCSYETYKKTNAFPNGTIFFKELQLTLGPAENDDGSRTEPSGRGYFPGSMALTSRSKTPTAMPIPEAGGTTISIIMSQKLQPPK